MSLLTLSLINTRYAPWGLLSDDEPPRQIVWLTEMQPTASVDSALLSNWDRQRIQQSYDAHIIVVDGLDNPNPEPKVDSSRVMPVGQEAPSKIADPQTIIDVTQLIREEAEKEQQLKDRVLSSYPSLDTILALSAGKAKKQLKELAKTIPSVSFFQEARKKEMSDKNRKTVIAVLVEIVQAKINAVGLDASKALVGGQNGLADAYYGLIEEYEDEDED